MDTKLLIVDDDPNIREMLTLYLEKEGYQVKTKENAYRTCYFCDFVL